MSILNWIAPFVSAEWLYGSLALLGLGAVIWYAPSIKIKLVAGAIAIVIVSFLAGNLVGDRNGYARCKGEWSRAEAAAVKLGGDTRSAGERDDASGMRDPNDRHNQTNPR